MPDPIPQLALIIAVYQRPDFLERVFTSLDNQTLRNFEVVLADDGSGPEIATPAPPACNVPLS